LVPETLNPAFAGTLITGYTGLIHRSQWPNETRRIDTEYVFVNGPIGPERNMGLGLSILNQREVLPIIIMFRSTVFTHIMLI
jgi:hypothetical protein